MKKQFTVFFICLFCLMFSFRTMAAEYQGTQPYDSYVYNANNSPIAIPSPYITENTYTGNSLGIGTLSGVSDLFYDNSDKIYFCDSGNNRIVIVDEDFQLIKVISDFYNTKNTKDSFNEPNGIFANDKYIYVADSANNRIVVLDINTYLCIKVLEKPVISLLEKDYIYIPKALVVDNTGRLYVLADGINQGIICLDENGNFETFLGAPEVEPNLFEQLWRSIATKSQRSQMQSYVPTEYSSIFIDERGFLYVTSESSKKVFVAKINTNGDNVLTTLKQKKQYGDMDYTKKTGAIQYPYFCDCAVLNDGTYFVLDSRQNKIYTYSDDGYLLYVFSQTGSQSGTFQTASSIITVGSKLIVSDSSKNIITVFSKTEFGESVSSALTLYKNGLYKEAKNALQQVEYYASDYPVAEILLAKIEMQNKDYSSAMKRLKLVGEDDLYNKAFIKARNEFIRENYLILILAIIFSIFVVIFSKKYIAQITSIRRIAHSELYKKIVYGKYTMLHPFDGFSDIKRENRGGLKAALIILSGFFLIYAIKAQVEGQNVLYTCGIMLFLIFLFILSSWCFTSLMDGEGTMKQIITATGYAFAPYTLFGIPIIIFSQLSGNASAGFSQFLNLVMVIWIVFLLISGMIVTQDYSLSKTILTLILTVIGMCIITFILLLFIYIVQEVLKFFFDSYRELSFRTY